MYHLLYQITSWIIVFPDDTPEEEALLIDLCKKINIFLCGKKV